MDAPDKDGSGRAEEESWSPGDPAVQYNRWRPSGHAFEAYLPPILSRQPNQNGMVHPLRVVVDRPIVVKLTKDIIETYQNCNPNVTYSAASNPKRYLTNPSVPALNNGLDNENSDMILAVNGELVNEQSNHRYVVKDLLGQGTFGQVAKCWADEKENFVAVKIIKNQPAYYQQALVEITILNMLNDKFDPEDKLHIVRILEHFVCQEHLCIVFEMLSVNLFELLKVNQFKGISLNLIRIFSKQILTALAVLREASVIHCDLKPENILLTTRPAAAELKLIDFGSACREYRTVYSYIQSRFYRSPEVVLGHEYTTAIDMWSCGCVAAELFLGLPLFPGQSQYDLLQRMIQILGGQPPDHILRNAKNTNKYFKHVGAPARHNDCNGEGQHSAYQFLSLPEYELREGEKPAIGKHYSFGSLEQRITNYHMKKRMSREEMEKERCKRFVFVDFLKGLLNFDPLKRWTPWQAAQHPFITEEPFMGSFQPPPESPRTPQPIRHGMTVDHNPVSGHWFGAGLSPRVNSTAVFQYGSQQYPGPPFSYASSYGSAGSYGSFGDGGLGLGNSFGSYGDAVGSYNHQTPSTKGNPNFGASPDNWRRINHVPHSALGHAPLGLSPSGGSFMPLSLGTSPSNFTPPSSHFQPSPGSPSTGSPSRYGPTSPARSGGGAAALSKAAAFGQYNKRRGWGSPGSAANTTSGSRSSVQDNSVAPWLARPNSYTGNDETSPFYIENTVQSSLSGSPGNPSLQGSHYAPQIRHRNEMAPGINSGQVQNSKSLSYPTGSLGALMSNTQPILDGGEDTSPPPNPGDWDPNYSEELLLQNDGGDTASSSVSVVTSLSGATGVAGTQGPMHEMPSGIGLVPLDTSARVRHDVHVQGGSQTAIFRSSGGMPYYMEGSSQPLQGHGWHAAKHPHFGHHSQISPSRLGQQTTQLLHQQLQHQYHPSNLHSSDHAPHSASITQQRVHHQFYAQSIQLSDQPFPFQTSGNNVMLNGETGGHAVLQSPKRDWRADHPQIMPSGGNFGQHNGLHIYPMSTGYPVFLDGYDPSSGLHTLDHPNFTSQTEPHWVSSFPTQRPMTNPNDWYNGRRFGNVNGALLPPSSRSERRDL